MKGIPRTGLLSRARLGVGVVFAFAAATTAWAMGSGPPVIIAQPQSQSVAVGSSVLFQVSAMGEPPLSCQWRFNGVPIAGATSFGLAVTNVTIDNVGAYAALVSNGSGATLSQPAYLSLSSYSYVVQLVPGWSAIANQLYLGSNLINQVLPNVSDGSSLFKFNPVIQDFDPADVFFLGVGWLDADLSLSTTVLAPGQGAFILSPQAISVTFVGAVHPPTGPLALETDGFNLVSTRVPRLASYEEITGLAPVAGATVDRWDPSLQNYRTHFFFQGRWTSGSPLAEVGKPLFVSFQPPLLITNQPADAVGVAPGTPVSFFVGAEAGRAPLYYQWRLNGVNIPDATNATLTIAEAQPITGGSYQALIRTGHPLLTPTSTKETEAADALASRAARLRVSFPTFPLANAFSAQTNFTGLSGRISGHNLLSSRESGEPSHAGKSGGRSVWVTWIAPTNGLVSFYTRGSSFDTLLAAYTGEAVNNLTELAGDDDSGGFATSFITFAATANSSYRIAIDGYNGATGDIVLNWFQQVSLMDPPRFTVQPVSQVVPKGATVTFSALATGVLPLTYQWLRYGVVLPGQTNSTLTLSNIQGSDLGVYRVVAANVGGSVGSKNATLEIASNSTLLSQDKLPDLLASLRPNPGLHVGTALPGSSSPPLLDAGSIGNQTFLNVASSSETGEANHAGFLGGASRWLALQAGTNGFITVDTIGSDVDTLLAIYAGSSLLNLTEIAQDNNGAADGVRSLVKFPAIAGTIYLIAVDAINGTQGTLALNWRLDVPPTIVIIALPANQTVLVCDNVTFTVAAAGPGPFTYQWQLNGKNIANATNLTLTLYAVQPGQSGRYRVVVSGPGGSTASPEAVLQVNATLCLRPDTVSYNASGLFQVLISGAAGRTVIVETSTNLLDAPWTPIYTNTTGLDPISFQHANAGSSPRRFYRAVVPP